MYEWAGSRARVNSASACWNQPAGSSSQNEGSASLWCREVAEGKCEDRAWTAAVAVATAALAATAAGSVLMAGKWLAVTWLPEETVKVRLRFHSRRESPV
jgi:hypothetical protein